jgi:hypothetical protein
MRLLDLFRRSRPRRAPRPRPNRVRCTVEELESRLVLTTSGLGSTPPPPPPPPPSPGVNPPSGGATGGTGWGR